MEVGHWNLAETKEKQKRAAEKRRRESAIVISQAKDPHDRLDMVLKDRFMTK